MNELEKKFSSEEIAFFERAKKLRTGVIVIGGLTALVSSLVLGYDTYQSKSFIQGTVSGLLLGLTGWNGYLAREGWKTTIGEFYRDRSQGNERSV